MSGKKKKKTGKIDLKTAILKTFSQNVKKTLNYKQVSKKLNIKDRPAHKLVQQVLENLKEHEHLIEVQSGKYRLKTTGSYIEGVLTASRTGACFVISDEINEQILIASKNLNTALNGDKVKAYVFAKKKSKIVEGEVLEILERAKMDYVGRLDIGSTFCFLIPDSRKMPFDIYIPLDDLKNAKNGQKAIARITRWDENRRNPYGKIIEILGNPGDNETEINSIIIEYGFDTKFPNKVENQAEQIPIEIPDGEIKKRKEYRKVTTFTIDPLDAKDFDDALSVKHLDNGNYEIGVHIADVAHYVIEGSILDKEAYKRGTSVYLVDRVVPMLPEKLSNVVCSLRPHEDKLCFSAIFEINKQAEVLNSWFGKTLIHSDNRFTYEQAQDVIDNKDKNNPFTKEIQVLNDLAKKLRDKRIREGSIVFDSEEVKFKLDEKKKPIGVYTNKMQDSNHLVEDFMLLANRKVAEFIYKLKSGSRKHNFVYRAHDPPPKDNLRSFSRFIKNFGYKINTSTHKTTAQSINKLLIDVNGKKEDHLFQTLAIKSMAKAIYTSESASHYGLGFDHYTHFTSPIRRYPDVMVHRLLYHYLNEGKRVDQNKIEQECQHSSEQERNAVRAERDSIKFKQAEYLQDHIGETFDGIISGISTWGIFVELSGNKCEGLVRLKDIDDDFYEVDEENYCIIGLRNRKKYQLGDPVKVRVKNIDLIKKYIDFELI
ncbi:MAG: ribonuclease R [Bacteroidetes bacterium]|nr:MAG: ribonuclease R [Bacteroidota bacterium]